VVLWSLLGGGAGARRVLYAAVLTFASDGFTRVVGEPLTP
jgi:hypothetical protein